MNELFKYQEKPALGARAGGEAHKGKYLFSILESDEL
jgi:hypothetical protein